MGYEVHISRKNDFDNYDEESNITMDEWRAMVDAADDLTWEPAPGAEIPGNFEYCYWLKHPEQDESNRPWFQFYGGSVSTKWTDTASLRLMLRMAEALKGRMHGDEGEFYEAADIDAMEQDQKQQAVAAEAPAPQKKPFWKFW